MCNREINICEFFLYANPLNLGLSACHFNTAENKHHSLITASETDPQWRSLVAEEHKAKIDKAQNGT